MTLYRISIVILILGLSLSSCAKQSDTHARIAVATNFLETAQKLESAFEAETDYTVDLVSGSTGQLYTQIINGAPYDVFLSADAARVTKLLNMVHFESETRLTYAVGQLVLYGEGNAQERLKLGDFQKLAIANPELAPYGSAAKETLEAMGLSVQLDKVVYGQNVGQVYGFVKTGNADLGFVALSQMRGADNYWRVPTDYHSAIRQDGVLLLKGTHNKSAKAFMNYLKTPAAQGVIKMSGYEVDLK